MDIKFYLRDPNAKGETAIFARISDGFRDGTTTNKKGETVPKYKQVKIYIGLKVKPANWNSNTFRAKESKSFPEHPEFNESLENIKSTLNSLFVRLERENKDITPELYKSEWDKLNNPEKVNEPPKENFLQFAGNYIEAKRATIKHGSFKSFRNSLRHISDFAKKSKISVDIEKIGFDFHFKLVAYLKKQGYKTNTIWRINKFVKYILRHARETGHTVLPDFESKNFTVKPYEPDTVYLTEDELQKIINLTRLSKKLDNVRDMFLVACYTGLRFSDFKLLSKQNFYESEGTAFLKITTQKTGEPVVIPVNHVVLSIIEKHEGFPKVISNQKFNEYIKQVCLLAEITTPVLVDSDETDEKKSVPKYTEISSHTGRRSFATNAFESGVPAMLLMKITGHRTETAFLRYIRTDKQRNAQLLSNYAFFNPQLKVAK